MSRNSMGKQSTELCASSSLISRGEGCPRPRHQRSTGSASTNSCGAICFRTHSTLRSENLAWCSPDAAEPYRTTETRRPLRARSNFVTNSFSSSIGLPVRRCSSPARIASAEATESATTTSAAKSTVRPASPAATASHQITEKHSGQEASESAASAPANASQEQEQKEDPDEDQRKRDGDRHTAILAARWDRRVGDGHALGLRDARAKLLRGGEQRASVVPLPQYRPDSAQNAAGVSIGDDRLQTVANFGPLFVILEGKDQEDPFVFAFLADAPLPVDGISDVINVVAFQGLYRHEGHLHTCGLFHTSGVRFECAGAARIQSSGKIVDVALRLELAGIERENPG